MQRISRKTHSAFINGLDSAFIALGANKQKCSWSSRRDEYIINTTVGKLTLIPDIPLCVLSGNRWRCTDLTCFGRFEEPEKAKKFVDCNPYSGKWNFHFGHCEEKDIEYCINQIIIKINKLL